MGSVYRKEKLSITCTTSRALNKFLGNEPSTSDDYMTQFREWNLNCSSIFHVLIKLSFHLELRSVPEFTCLLFNLCCVYGWLDWNAHLLHEQFYIYKLFCWFSSNSRFLGSNNELQYHNNEFSLLQLHLSFMSNLVPLSSASPCLFKKRQ